MFLKIFKNITVQDIIELLNKFNKEKINQKILRRNKNKKEDYQKKAQMQTFMKNKL